MTAKEELIKRVHECLANQFNITKQTRKAAEDALENFWTGMSDEAAEAFLELANKMGPNEKHKWGSFEFLFAFLAVSSAGKQVKENGTAEDAAKAIREFVKSTFSSDRNNKKDFWNELIKLTGGDDEPLKSFKSIAPDKYLIPTGKVARGITEQDDFDALVIRQQGKAPAVKTSVVLNVANDDGISFVGKKTISKFDMAIMNAVISHIAEGNLAISAAMVYRTAAGLSSDHDITDNQERKAESSIEKLRRTFAKIDATAEAKRYAEKKGYKIDSWVKDRALLECTGEDAIINGTRVKAYTFNRHNEPLIYEYAKISGQILALPMEYASMPLSATENNIILRNYLWLQIGAIKNSKAKRRSEISYEGIYKELGIDITAAGGRVKAQRAREATTALLENWMPKKDKDGNIVSEGAITSFALYPQEKKPLGVRIEV